MLGPRILTACTVEDLGGMQYEVRVWGGLEPFDHERIYTVKGTSEDNAAKQGMELFMEEMEVLYDMKDD
jgi:hypothetical protein